MMSFIDVAIPGVIGLLLLLKPAMVFSGSRAAPDEKKIRLMRRIGVVLLVVAAIALVIHLIGIPTR
jgi:hypothetical protein